MKPPLLTPASTGKRRSLHPWLEYSSHFWENRKFRSQPARPRTHLKMIIHQTPWLNWVMYSSTYHTSRAHTIPSPIPSIRQPPLSSLTTCIYRSTAASTSLSVSLTHAFTKPVSQNHSSQPQALLINFVLRTVFPFNEKTHITSLHTVVHTAPCQINGRDHKCANFHAHWYNTHSHSSSDKTHKLIHWQTQSWGAKRSKEK